MILTELNIVKSFGSQLESTVTPEDIAAKEKKLKIKLPEALKDLYLTFHPEDPLFSGSCALVPFEELKLQRVRRVYWNYVLLPFAWCEEEQTYYYMGVEQKSTPKNRYCHEVNSYQEETDPPVFFIRDKKVWQSNYSGALPLSEFILRWLFTQRLYSMPSVLGLKELPNSVWDQLPCLNQRVKNIRLSLGTPPAFFIAPGFFWSPPADFAPSTICHYEEGHLDLETLIGCRIGARRDEPLEELLEGTGLEPRWQRSQNGHEIFQYKVPEQPKPFRPQEERPLLSIAPVLDFLCKFAGAEGPRASEESIANAEARLGGALPLPLREYYQYMPKACYRGQNYLTPPGNLRLRKDGKITFLSENQLCCYWGVARDSSFLFERENEDRAPWEPAGILDGFLVWEFILDLVCSGKLELEMSAYPGFRLDMLEEGGVLRPLLSDIAGITPQIAVGNFLQMYQGMDGRLVAVCESETPKLYLFAREAQTIHQFCAVGADSRNTEFRPPEGKGSFACTPKTPG